MFDAGLFVRRLWLAMACVSLAAAGASAQQSGSCAADRANFALGQPYSSDLADRARQAAGARIVRKLEPGAPATTDLRQDRLNLQVDGQEIVTRVTCG